MEELCSTTWLQDAISAFDCLVTKKENVSKRESKTKQKKKLSIESNEKAVDQTHFTANRHLFERRASVMYCLVGARKEGNLEI